MAGVGFRSRIGRAVRRRRRRTSRCGPGAGGRAEAGSEPSARACGPWGRAGIREDEVAPSAVRQVAALPGERSHLRGASARKHTAADTEAQPAQEATEVASNSRAPRRCTAAATDDYVPIYSADPACPAGASLVTSSAGTGTVTFSG